MVGGMEFPDERWVGLSGGYHMPYDPRPALRSIEASDDKAAWAELWNELHHKGDVGEASYAALPALAQLALMGIGGWQPYALAVTIEEARRNGRNPPLPGWLDEHYATAWTHLFDAALAAMEEAKDALLVCSLLAVQAMHKEQPLLARLAILTEAERADLLSDASWA